MTGAGYAPSTEVTVAVCYYDPAAQLDAGGIPEAMPRYAAKVITSGSSTFLIEFVTGDATILGRYHVIAEPEITAESWLNPIVGSFEIE